MYNYVIFDLDGTLANTVEDLANAVNYGLKKNNLPVHPTDAYYHFVGNGVINLIKRALGNSCSDKLVQQLKSDFDCYYGEHNLDKTVGYAGVYDMLKLLQEKNIKMAVLSNKPHSFVGDILDKLFPGITFAAAWGKKDKFKIKPDPQSLFALMEEIGADKATTLYVGDSDVDVQTAINGNVDFAGAEWGFRGKKELMSAGAKYTFESPRQMCDFIVR